eukprot:CAMPEP_0116100060 /NCGR_PEP_ID=MMETSP0327-20121206/12096_1 /TAXON_ID=44447 /ORGANISM="Pseudo-nitzschia delicatissima, Strain B596" /LENGTH=195 /DNA_ID=CAMNT_0003591971 /DNA_START=254 /DNA_END=841 /DNA_ORIENTATION=-
MSSIPLSSAAPTMQADTKISNDLAILKEKMNLLDSMIFPTDSSAPKLSVKTNEAVRSVVGYLDACGPRMIELVTACMSRDGVVSEEVFGDVLACNDRLQKLLGDVDTLLLVETPASTTAASAAAAEAAPTSEDLTDQFGDLLLGDENPFAEPDVPTAGAKTTGEEEEDEKPIAAPAAAAKDPFDDFFAERTGTGF